MGTSINQGSPDTTAWAMVATCYDHEVPISETAIEIWRAATTQNPDFVRQLKSEAIEVLLKRRLKPAELSDIFSRSFAMKQHSIAGELAMRGILANIEQKNESPLTAFFRQMTEYFVARDISGHVGPAHRCKTFAEVRIFKTHVSDAVAATVRSTEAQHQLSSKRWSEVVPIVVKALTK